MYTKRNRRRVLRTRIRNKGGASSRGSKKANIENLRIKLKEKKKDCEEKIDRIYREYNVPNYVDVSDDCQKEVIELNRLIEIAEKGIINFEARKGILFK